MLSKTIDFTWELLMLQACQVYIIVIQPALIYRAIVWHHPQLTPTAKLSTAGIIGKLAKLQNKCIQRIAGIYKKTSLLIVKTEVFILFLDIYLDSVVFQAVKRMKKSGIMHQIKIACTNIRRKLL
jgi:hypothetical protein